MFRTLEDSIGIANHVANLAVLDEPFHFDRPVIAFLQRFPIDPNENVVEFVQRFFVVGRQRVSLAFK